MVQKNIRVVLIRSQTRLNQLQNLLLVSQDCIALARIWQTLINKMFLRLIYLKHHFLKSVKLNTHTCFLMRMSLRPFQGTAASKGYIANHSSRPNGLQLKCISDIISNWFENHQRCPYNVLTSSVPYYWTDAWQHEIYLLNKEWVA